MTSSSKKRAPRREEIIVVRGAAPGESYELHTDRKTSQRLGRVRQRGTKPELLVRRALHRRGLRYRLNARDLPGSPDIVNRSRKWAIFVHGCYWHSHQGCRLATVPSRNRDFWEAKFTANRARDARNVEALEGLGYHVVVIWQCETEDGERLEQVLDERLDS